MKFPVILTPDRDEGGYVADCPAIPGCVSQGASVEEAIVNIREAIEGCLESLAARQQPLPRAGDILFANVDVKIPAAAAA